MGSAGQACPNDAPPPRVGETNFRVRNCHICHLKSLEHLRFAGRLLRATASVADSTTEELG